jgi:hypothetical protein
VGAKTIFTGFGIGILYQAAHRAFLRGRKRRKKSSERRMTKAR